MADDIVGGYASESAVGQTATGVWSAGSEGLTWDLMISMDPEIAEIRQARRNDVQDRPSIPRRERMSLFLGAMIRGIPRLKAGLCPTSCTSLSSYCVQRRGSLGCHTGMGYIG